MTKTIIGIDNGVSGGLAALSDSSQILSTLPMPILASRAGREVDIAGVWHWISEIDGIEKITVIIEEPGGSKSAKAAKSMAGSFHALRALCVLKKLRWHRITPQSWQKVMLPGCKSGESKARALALAKQLWPDETWIQPRCRTPADGIVDAVLIAEWARRNKL